MNSEIANTARKLIGAFIKERRKELGWSQAFLANKSEIRQATVNDVENGRNYEINTLLAILGAMRGFVSIEWREMDSIPGMPDMGKN